MAELVRSCLQDHPQLYKQSGPAMIAEVLASVFENSDCRWQEPKQTYDFEYFHARRLTKPNTTFWTPFPPWKEKPNIKVQIDMMQTNMGTSHSVLCFQH